ncbi:MAG: restriction endonuclease subunit S [Bacilli bacterium]|nr:restriction endonuclease subunit S [Bacilli bacterium]
MSRTMKYTGIEWLGEIPESWEVKKVRNVFFRRKEINQTSDPIILSLARDGVKVRDISNNEGQLAESYDNYHIVYKGDLMINPMDLVSGANCSVSENEGVISPAYINLAKKVDCNSRYFDYYFKNQYWVKAMFIHGKGVSFDNRWTITAETLMNYYIPFPAKEEQDKIATYLDEKTKKIDYLIEKNKEIIKLLNDYFKSLTTEYTTGKRYIVQKKDSEIEWIGEIPKTWNIISFKNIMKERNEKNNPVKSKTRLSLSIDKGITTYSEKTTNLDRFKEEFEQYKLAHIGDLVFNSMNMIVGAVGYSNYYGCVSPVYYTYYDEDGEYHYYSRFYEYLFRSKGIRKKLYSIGRGIISFDKGDDQINTCRLKISRDDLRGFKVPLPPYNEIKTIVDDLDERKKQINNVIKIREQIIEKLEEYKKSLIYECVTGKREV